MNDNHRILFLDDLRGIAILVVVWAHVFVVGINDSVNVKLRIPQLEGLMFGEGSPSLNVHDHVNLFFVLNLGVGTGHTGVLIFFLVSGFIILRSLDGGRPGLFLIKRFFRLIPTCAAVTFLIAALTLMLCYFTATSSPYGLDDLVMSSLLLHKYFPQFHSPIPVLWSLEVEMAFYLLMAAAVRIKGKLSLKSLFAMTLVCFGGSAIFLYAAMLSPATYEWFPRHTAMLLTMSSYLLVGASIYRATQVGWRKSIMWVLATFLVCMVTIAVFEPKNPMPGGQYNLRSFLAALLIFFFVWGVRKVVTVPTPLNFFARISYSLYLVHVPFAWGVMWLLSQFGFGMYLSASLGAACSVALAWVVFHVIEQPSHRLAKQIGRESPKLDAGPISPINQRELVSR
ncbi:hypothetical protein ASF69_04725 [Rhizobium sp. Leaf311]|uniref:acyltransferase family protein n=1 Tax=Rhizobium sp. Leaf311 TaxID=1736332 RepID=UPI000715DE02|nr:acyltransferase [Rhizobium sp. Leaf311]KQQ46535.1 hypothetical protein ASF69_04725 [Rhizobium sp. Leaf311]